MQTALEKCFHVGRKEGRKEGSLHVYWGECQLAFPAPLDWRDDKNDEKPLGKHTHSGSSNRLFYPTLFFLRAICMWERRL